MVKFSNAFSFAGYDFSVWLARNKDTLKLLGAAIGGVLFFFAGHFAEPWNVFASAVVTGLGKLALDAVDFFSSKVQL